MRRILFILLPILLLATSVAAQDETIQITWPPPVYAVSGAVQVTGTVNPPDLQSYFLEVADYGADNPLWIPVSLPSTQPIENGVVAQWVTTLVPDGLYQLRLHVVLRSGDNRYAVVGPIRVANTLQRPEGETVAPQPVVPTATEEPAPVEPTAVVHPSPVNELPVPVGGQVDTFDEQAVQFMQQAGMIWMKWQVPFTVGDDSLVTVAQDRINWSHERGFLVLLSIKGDVTELDAQGEDYYPLFADFLGRVAALHPDAIEVWNEMNIDREWPTGQIDPRAYLDMLRPAYEAIKAADSQVMVITGALAPTGAEGAFGLSRVWNDDRYYQGMANAGAADYADCIGVHYNEGIIAPLQQGGDPRDSYPTRYFPLMTNRAAFPFRSSSIPLCYTELGYLSPEGYGRLPSEFAWAANTSVVEQAQWLHDAIQIAGDDGRIAMIVIFNVNIRRFDQDPQAGYAIIRPDNTCPACEAIATLRGQ